MNWQKQVKLLYGSTLIVGFFTIANFLTAMAFKNYLNYNIIIISVLTLSIIYYFLDRINAKLLIILSLIASSLIVFIFLDDKKIAVESIFFLNTSIFINLYGLESDVKYSECKNSLGTLIVISIILSTFMEYISNMDVFSYNLKSYIVYSILFILNLRETMKYDNEIIDPKAKYYNLIISGVAILFTSSDKAINLLKLLESFIRKIINFVAQLCSSVIKGPMEYGIDALNSLFKDKEIVNKGLNKATEGLAPPKGAEELSKIELSINYEILEKIIKVLFIVVVIYLVIIAIKKYKHIFSFKENKNTYEEYSEKIFKDKLNKENKYSKIKTIFRKKGNTRDEILYTYRKFELSTDKIGILKKYMTPTQLKNIYKIEVSSEKEIDEFTSIYNEVKFSNHEVDDENLNKAKGYYKKLKKQIINSKLQKGK